jgi:hypothetical protein
MQFLIFGDKLFFAFSGIRVRHNAIHRADFHALGFRVHSFALGAQVRIYYVDGASGADGFIGTDRNAGVAADTFLVD